MKSKTFVAYALAACTIPVASALAAQPSGPQGTGWYGAPNAAVPVPQLVLPYYEHTHAGAWTDPRMDNPMRDRAAIPNGAGERWVYQGPSFSTNPPAPAP